MWNTEINLGIGSWYSVSCYKSLADLLLYCFSTVLLLNPYSPKCITANHNRNVVHSLGHAALKVGFGSAISKVHYIPKVRHSEGLNPKPNPTNHNPTNPTKPYSKPNPTNPEHNLTNPNLNEITFQMCFMQDRTKLCTSESRFE